MTCSFTYFYCISCVYLLKLSDTYQHLAIGNQLTFYCSKFIKPASHPLQDQCTAALQAVITHEIITRSGGTFTQLCQHIL